MTDVIMERGKGRMLTRKATFPRFLLISCSPAEERFAKEKE